jgi:hypothetical protein
MRRPLIGREDSKLPLGKGNKLKERSWRLTKGEGSLWGWKKGVVHERDVRKN